LDLPPAKKELNKVWNSDITLAKCVHEVAYFKDLVLWCTNKFDTNKRIIQMQRKPPISLSPSFFKRMSRLPNPTMLFKNEEADKFLKDHQGEVELLDNYLTNLRIDNVST